MLQDRYALERSVPEFLRAQAYLSNFGLEKEDSGPYKTKVRWGRGFSLVELFTSCSRNLRALLVAAISHR